jgi:hypothetical protein
MSQILIEPSCDPAIKWRPLLEKASELMLFLTFESFNVFTIWFALESSMLIYPFSCPTATKLID